MATKIIPVVQIDKFDGDMFFLSNFYESEIIYEGIKYPTNEHAFQAAKTFDKNVRQAIANAPTPGVAKRMGRQVDLREDWEQVKEQVMLDCVREKFKNPVLRAKLINTAPLKLIEGNTWHDNCWGDCSCERCKNKQGRNLLGQILMKVRDEIMREMNKKETVKLLVVVDMQNDFVAGSLGTKEAQAIVPNVVKKVKEYADNGDMVVFTMDTHKEDYLDTAEGKKLPVPHCIENTEGWEIISELKPYQVKDYGINRGNTFIKHTFGSTELADFISKLEGNCCANDKKFEAEFIGICTDICVVSNVLMTKAHIPHINVKVDASCCAGVTPQSHKEALNTMKMCQIEVIGE